ncbi:MAG: PH domain-containing protein [Actinomycetota bacterium]|nr:PH domain-containing protein [Actinomycetota bacterium]
MSWTAPSGEPTTWARLDVRMLLVHPVNELLRFLPAIIGIFFVGNSSGNGFWWHLGGVAIPILLGVARFATTSYRIADGQIQLRRGLVNRNVLTAPLDRVRTVELTSSLIHRVLGLAKVQIGTGSAVKRGDERIVLDSLASDHAHRLRGQLLHRGTAQPTTAQPAEPATARQPAPVDDEVVLRLDPRWARYAPLTTSGLVIALGALGFLSQTLRGLPGAPERTVGHAVTRLPLVLAVVGGIVTALVLVSVLAVLGYFAANWGFTLLRDRGNRSYHVRRGLFTTRETSIDRERIRGLEIHEPLGLRLAGGARLSAIVTGLGRRERGSSPLVPAAPRAVVVGVGEYVLGEAGPFTVPLGSHGPAARRRRYTRALLGSGVLPAAVLAGGLGGLWPLWWVPVALLALLPGALLARDRYARLGHALTGEYLVVRSGSFRGRRDALQRQGIIGWNITQSFFQRRAGLATLTATTAAGRQGYSALDIPESWAVALAEQATPALVGSFLTRAGVTAAS